MICRPARPYYRPSGRFHLGYTALMLGPLAGATLLMALVLYLEMSRGFVFPILWLLFPEIIAVIAITFTVFMGHCRNRVLACVLATACSVGGYALHFHFDQCLTWNVPWTAIDRLPGYITFRMETDRWVSKSKEAMHQRVKPAAGIVPWRPISRTNFLSWNWSLLLLDVTALSVVNSLAAIEFASNPYNERRKDWHKSASLMVTRNAGQALAAALASGTVDRWAQSDPQRAERHENPAHIYLNYSPWTAEHGVDEDVFLAVLNRRHYRLWPEEVAALVPLFPELLNLVGQAKEQLAQVAEQTGDPHSARIWPVQAPFAGQAQSRLNRALGVATYLVVRFGGPIVVLLPLIVVAVGLRQQFAAAHQGLPWWFAGAGGLVALAYVQFIRLWLGSRWQVDARLLHLLEHGFLCRAISVRPDPLVAADDPEAIFAEMCPRKMWGARSFARTEYNQGLLRIDFDRQAIVFEGDYERYWVPAGAILECRLEVIGAEHPTTGSPWGVVVRHRLGDGIWELPLLPLRNLRGRTNWGRALALLAALEALCERTFDDQPKRPAEAAAH